MQKTALRPLTLITGGSQGIGKALAFEFAQTGHDLLLVSRNEKKLAETAQLVSQKYGVKALILAFDLSLVESLQAIETLLHNEQYYVQNLVNNAGFGLAGPFAEHRPETLRAMVDLNVRALTDLSQLFLPDMLARNTGGILNVSSMGGLLPGPYQAAYFASKAYVISLTQALSWECLGTGVHISTLAPGPVRTDFHATMGARSDLYVKSGGGISAQKAARLGYSGFKCGQCLIIPSFLGQLGALALKFLPHDLLMPVMGWFLKARIKRHGQ